MKKDEKPEPIPIPIQVANIAAKATRDAALIAGAFGSGTILLVEGAKLVFDADAEVGADGAATHVCSMDPTDR